MVGKARLLGMGGGTKPNESERARDTRLGSGR